MKKIIFTVLLIGSILLAPLKSIAAGNCLDIRDYGYHRYKQRTYIVRVIMNEIRGCTPYGLHVKYIDERQDECVCGLRTSVYTYSKDYYY